MSLSSKTESMGKPTRPIRSDSPFTFMVLALGGLTFTMLQFLVIPALPTIDRDITATQAAGTWVLTVFLISVSVSSPIVGRLGDLFGKKRMLVLSLIVIALGSCLGGRADSLPELLVARAIQGTGGGILPLAFGIIRDQSPQGHIPSRIAYFNTSLSIGAGLGVLLAGPVVDHLSTHWLFWLPAIIAALAALGAFLYASDSHVKAPGPFNFGAALLLSAWLIALLVATSQGQSWGWKSVPILGLFAGGLVLASLWVAVELRSTFPLVDLHMVRLPIVSRVNAAAFLFGAGQLSAYVVIPPFVQTPLSAGYGFGASTGQGALFLLPTLVFSVVGSVIFARIAAATHAKIAMVSGSLINAAAFALLSAAHDEAWHFYVATASLGFGIGLVIPSMTNLIVAAVPQTQTGVATGMNNNIRTLGQAIGSQIAGGVVTAGVIPGMLPREQRYVMGFIVVALAFSVAAFVSLGVPGRRRDPQGYPRSSAAV
jgi:MFS family permease